MSTDTPSGWVKLTTVPWPLRSESSHTVTAAALPDSESEPTRRGESPVRAATAARTCFAFWTLARRAPSRLLALRDRLRGPLALPLAVLVGGLVLRAVTAASAVALLVAWSRSAESVLPSVEEDLVGAVAGPSRRSPLPEAGWDSGTAVWRRCCWYEREMLYGPSTGTVSTDLVPTVRLAFDSNATVFDFELDCCRLRFRWTTTTTPITTAAVAAPTTANRTVAVVRFPVNRWDVEAAAVDCELPDEDPADVWEDSEVVLVLEVEPVAPVLPVPSSPVGEPVVAAAAWNSVELPLAVLPVIAAPVPLIENRVSVSDGKVNSVSHKPRFFLQLLSLFMSGFLSCVSSSVGKLSFKYSFTLL